MTKNLVQEEPAYSFQLERWRDAETGKALVVEERDNPWAMEYDVYLVEEDDTTVDTHIVDSSQSLHYAALVARKFRQVESDSELVPDE